MWDYLKKYKNNHTTSSLPRKTRFNVSTDKQNWKQGPPTLNPLNWHCFKFALGQHLFQPWHPLSPYDETSAQGVAELLPRFKEQACIATTTTHLLFMAPFTSDKLNNEIKKQLPDKSPGLLESPTACYKQVTLISKPHSHFLSRLLGISHTTHRLVTLSPTTYLQRTQQG